MFVKFVVFVQKVVEVQVQFFIVLDQFYDKYFLVFLIFKYELLILDYFLRVMLYNILIFVVFSNLDKNILANIIDKFYENYF